MRGTINAAEAKRAGSHVFVCPDTCRGKTASKSVEGKVKARTFDPVLLDATLPVSDPFRHTRIRDTLTDASWGSAQAIQPEIAAPAEDHASSGNLDQHEVNLLIEAMNRQGGEYRIFSQPGQQGMVRIVENGVGEDILLTEDNLDAETYWLFAETRANIEEYSGTEIMVPTRFCLVSRMPEQILTEDGAFCVHGKETYAFRDQDLTIISEQTFGNKFRRYCMFAHEAGNTQDRQAGLSAQAQQEQGLKREYSMLQALELVGISADEVASFERELARIEIQLGLRKAGNTRMQDRQITVSKAPLSLGKATDRDHELIKELGPNEQDVPVADWQLSMGRSDITQADSDTLSLKGTFGQASFSASADIGSGHFKVLTELEAEVKEALISRLKRSGGINQVLLEAREAKMQATKSLYEALALHIDEAEAKAKDSLTGVHLREITVKGSLGSKYAFTASINNSKGHWSVPPYDTSQIAGVVIHKLITQDTKALDVINKEVTKHRDIWEQVVVHNRSSFPTHCNRLFIDETSEDFMGRSRGFIMPLGLLAQDQDQAVFWALVLVLLVLAIATTGFAGVSKRIQQHVTHTRCHNSRG